MGFILSLQACRLKQIQTCTFCSHSAGWWFIFYLFIFLKSFATRGLISFNFRRCNAEKGSWGEPKSAWTRSHARTRTRGSSAAELSAGSHCTSVHVSGDDKWRASQSKPICTSIRRGAKWGSTCIFLPAEQPYISAKTLPRGDGIRGRQRREGEVCVCVCEGEGGGTHSTQILGGVK